MSEHIVETWTGLPADVGFCPGATVFGATLSYAVQDDRAQRAELAHLLASIDTKLDAAEHRMDALLARLGAA